MGGRTLALCMAGFMLAVLVVAIAAVKGAVAEWRSGDGRRKR